MPASGATQSQRVWLDHLRVMGELPYPSLAVMPSIAALVRDRLGASFASFGWVQGERLEPEAFWVEHGHEAAFRWFKAPRATAVADSPFRSAGETDGDVLRQLTDRPGSTGNPMDTPPVPETCVARRMCCLPLALAQGGRYGVLYLYRSREQARFSDADMAVLRLVRGALGPLDLEESPYRHLPPAPEQAAAQASMVFDDGGRLLSRGAAALPLLFLARGPGIDVVDGAGTDIAILPEPIRAEVRAWMRSASEGDRKLWVVSTTWGTFEFACESLQVLAGEPGTAQRMLTLTYREPLDLSLARRLSAWPLSPQEKRILIASTRDIGVAEIAATVGVTVGSVKNYINGILQRFGARNRGDLVARILGTQVPGDPLMS